MAPLSFKSILNSKLSFITNNKVKKILNYIEIMPENVVKVPRSASPVARTGAGDISERELSRERHTLHTTPPARLQPVHPKKQLFFTPVNKFTASSHGPTPHLARIRSCLEELTAANTATQARRQKITPRFNSMEDLTPTKRMKKANPKNDHLPIIRSPSTLGAGADVAAARVARFMVVCAWRRRRNEVRCLRKTLEFQVSCSERLRMQVVALKSLLDSDNAKVRMAMRELERLKQLVKDKDKEKAVLEREKLALEDDVCAAEDRTSEMSIGWRNCRNELEGMRASATAIEHALAVERAAAADARAQRDHALDRLSAAEDELTQLEDQLAATEDEADTLRSELAETQIAHEELTEQLDKEKNIRLACGLEIAALTMRVSRADEDSAALRAAAADLRAQLEYADRQLMVTREQLEWWPKPLTKLIGALRWWVRRPSSLRAALLWSCVPPTHGATQLTHTLYLI